MIVATTFNPTSTLVVTLERDESLSVFAKNRLPAHFKEDFPTFSEFLGTYYSALNSAKSGYTTIETIKDLDAAGKMYLEAMYRTYGSNIPEFEFISMADFIRNSRHFFSSKGSEESFKFLFRIMFGVEIDIKYPKENMLTPSSGNWSQQTSIYVDFQPGSVVDALIGKKLLVRGATGDTSEIRAESVTHVSGTVYEISYSGVSSYAIVIGASVLDGYSASTGNYITRGTIVPVLNQYNIITPGSDFNIGSVYSVTSSTGDISFRVTGIDNNRGIKRIEFLTFAGSAVAPQTLSVGGASIQFTPGPINKYTGFYADTKGFLSDNNKLQDSFFYQIFSYVIKSRISRELYIDLFVKTMHPAGLEVFSENEKINETLLNILSVSASDSKTMLFDVVQMYDVLITHYEAHRVVSDTVYMTEHIRTNWSSSKAWVDTIGILDTLRKVLTKGFTDNVSMTDTLRRGVGKALTDNVAITDDVTKVFTKYVSDGMVLTDTFST